MNTLFQLAFGDAAELTNAVNKSPYNVPLLGSLNIYQESGIATTSAMVEFENRKLVLLPTSPRGGVSEPHQGRSRELVTVQAVRVSTRFAVWADEVQDVRAFGGVGLDSPEALRDRKLADARGNIELTNENLRFGALRGQMIDVDGTVLQDNYALFGIAQSVIPMDLAGTGNLTVKVINAERVSEAALGGATPTGFLCLASASFMDALRSSSYYDSAARFATPADMFKNYRTGIQIGDTFFLEARSTPGHPVKVAPGDAYLFPMGVRDLFLAKYAPADYVSTVNTPGLPLYATSQEMSMAKGWHVEVQSNPIFMCTRPASVVKLTVA